LKKIQKTINNTPEKIMVSASEGIRNLQERLQLIETKAIIRESLEQTYYLDENNYMYNSSGEQITDFTTILVINEAYESGQVTLSEFDWGKAGKAVTAPFAALGNVGRGVNAVVKSGERGSRAVSKVANRVGGLRGAGLKAGAAIARNPLKTAAAAGALGAGAGYLGKKLAGGDNPPPTPGPGPSPRPPRPNVQPDKEDPAPTPTPTPEPTPSPTVDPEINQAELDEMDQLARIIGKYSDPVSAELMGGYNLIRPNLPKAKEVPGEMEESIARYIRKVNRKR
jgi:hypothetical protein